MSTDVDSSSKKKSSSRGGGSRNKTGFRGRLAAIDGSYYVYDMIAGRADQYINTTYELTIYCGAQYGPHVLKSLHNEELQPGARRRPEQNKEQQKRPLESERDWQSTKRQSRHESRIRICPIIATILVHVWNSESNEAKRIKKTAKTFYAAHPSTQHNNERIVLKLRQ